MKPMYIVDLDDNLGQVQRKCPAGLDVATLRVMSVGSDGTPRSFMTPQQSALFDMMRASGDVTPCTLRDYAGFKRVRIPFDGHAIVSYGGAIVMPDGTLEPRWQAHIVEQAAQAKSTLLAIAERARKFVESERITGAHVKLQCEVFDGVETPLFLLVKQHEEDNSSLQWLATLLAAEKSGPRLPDGWKIHCNDSTLAVFPPFLRKGLALKFLLDEVLPAKPAFTVGMGDSIDDGGFAGICDFAMMPTGSQIFGLVKKEVTDVPR